MCPHTLGGFGGLICDRVTPHDATAAGGHTYSGSSVEDGHQASEDAAERARG